MVVKPAEYPTPSRKPSFVWFQADFPATSARIMHSCNVVGKGGGQRIVIGGVDPTAPNVSKESRDPWSSGINIFDMSQLQWKDSNSPNDAKYQTPVVITEWYTQHRPCPSFQNATLKKYFHKEYRIKSKYYPTTAPFG